VYAYTGGVRPGDPVVATGAPLGAELGPGLLGGVYDGMLRRLSGAEDMLRTGVRAGALDPERRWSFRPLLAAGAEVTPGAILGEAPESEAITFRAIVPHGIGGTVEWIAPAGDYTVAEPIARIGGDEIALAHRWPVRRPRPVRERLRADVPLITGQRALDLFFPIARGSCAAVPGGFGTGKTVLLQQIAKWCDADVIVYVGCGERGNEMAGVLEEMAQLDDPRTGRSLLDRTVLIANTSNMPVLAREASIYTGVTVAEFYRDMGYDAVLIADSTSRWAEALREVASRTGELPAEEGYPAGLASALAAFYERAGRVRTCAGADASVTILGAVSPPGGDMTEPVSAHTRRFVRCTWSLDPELAYARHYPAVSWRDSSSRDAEVIAGWHVANHEPQWAESRERALRLLAEADHLEAIAQLVGGTSLPDRERVVLVSGRLLREAVLQQSSLSADDAYCAPRKQRALLVLVLALHDRCLELVASGVPVDTIEGVDLSPATRARDATPPDGAEEVEAIQEQLLARLGEPR
jgi:V/A-type H+-transporting ATPase subunit A